MKFEVSVDEVDGEKKVYIWDKEKSDWVVYGIGVNEAWRLGCALHLVTYTDAFNDPRNIE